MATVKHTQDRKLVSKEPHELAYLCRKFHIRKDVLTALIAALKHRRSREEVEACIIGYLMGKKAEA